MTWLSILFELFAIPITWKPGLNSSKGKALRQVLNLPLKQGALKVSFEVIHYLEWHNYRKGDARENAKKSPSAERELVAGIDMHMVEVNTLYNR